MKLKSFLAATAFAALASSSAMAADVIRTFAFSATLSDGAVMSGDLLIDVTTGLAVGSSIQSSAPDDFVSTFVSAQQSQFYSPDTYAVNVRNTALTEDFDFGIEGISLVGYTGGTVPFGNLFDLTTNTAGPGFRNGALTAVPEPATWAIMLAGFGALGASLRARRRAAVQA